MCEIISIIINKETTIKRYKKGIKMGVDRYYTGLKVKVEWVDSCVSNTEWVLRGEFKDYSLIRVATFGQVVEQTDEYIVVAQNVGENPKQYCNLMTIPLGCVKSINEITILN